ncbi:hypothetical protein [Endozoicomonas sp. GU-1]|nr:hypothetical protein [Endozoicomonas sp. GU-1]WBA82303.1 hypothetical protein O2T12_03865 [Endozoicomonas sp. GU-1]WBA85239.1 hypothetical protein O3276_18550 [Endozoicomonas sp. GU-1]
MGNSCPRLPEKTEPGSRNPQRDNARADNILNPQITKHRQPQIVQLAVP